MKWEVLIAEIRLALLEWKSLLVHSALYKRDIIKQAFDDSVIETVIATVRKISQKGRKARLKLTRILIRMLSSALNQNAKAFEAALKDLIDLGRPD